MSAVAKPSQFAQDVLKRWTLWLLLALAVSVPAQAGPAHMAARASAPAQRFGPPIVGVLRFDNLVYQTARRYHIDYALVMAVIHTESLFNPHATSNKGAAGLMQLMPATANKYGAKDRYNPRQNIEAGVRYLKALLQRYPGELDHALAAYNAGEAAVDRYQGIPPYPETRDYVRKVLRYRAMYANWP